MSGGANPSSNALVSFVNSQQIRSNLSLMRPEEKDELFMNMFIANAIAINEVTTQLEHTQEEAGALKGRVEQQENDLNQVCALANSMTLDNVNLVIEKTWFPEKELIWKRRVMEALMRVNPSARPNEVEQAYLTNQNTRQQLREFINGYKRNWGCLSARKETLICYAKLVLKDNPLISWEMILPMLENAKQKITEKRPRGYIYSENCFVARGDWPSGFEECFYQVSYVLHPQKAAGLLFSNPDIPNSQLWTMRVTPTTDPSMDYSY